MHGIIFALLSGGFILFTSTLYHMKEARKSENYILRKRAGQLGFMSVVSIAAAVLLSYM